MKAESIVDQLAKAAAAHAAASADVQATTARVAEAQSAFDADRSKVRRLALSEAVADRESAERVVVKMAADLERAKRRAAEVEREQRVAELAALEARLAEWQQAIDDGARRLSVIDAEIVATVSAIAAATKRSAETHARGLLLATQLGQGARFATVHTPPTITEARLRATRALTTARLETDRPALAPAWLANASLGEAGFNSAELESIRPHVAAARATEATAAILRNATNPQEEHAK